MASDKKFTIDLNFVGILTTAFIVLKLCNVITWSWWWVLSPLWITALLGGIFLTIALIIFIWVKR
jgi:hypothetical protein